MALFSGSFTKISNRIVEKMFPFLSLFRKAPLPLGRPTQRWIVARKFSYHNICLVKLNERLFQVSPCQTRPTTCVCVYCGVAMESGKSVCYHDFNEWELSFIDTSNFLFKSITSAHSFHTCFAFALSVHSLTGLRNFLSASTQYQPCLKCLLIAGLMQSLEIQRMPEGWLQIWLAWLSFALYTTRWASSTESVYCCETLLN